MWGPVQNEIAGSLDEKSLRISRWQGESIKPSTALVRAAPVLGLPGTHLAVALRAVEILAGDRGKLFYFIVIAFQSSMCSTLRFVRFSLLTSRGQDS